MWIDMWHGKFLSATKGSHCQLRKMKKNNQGRSHKFLVLISKTLFGSRFWWHLEEVQHISYEDLLPEEATSFSDDESSMNLIITIDLIRKLKLKTKLHPQPYKLEWLSDKNHMVVAHRCLLHIDLGNGSTYKVYCDIVEMELADILLGWPWLYDREAVHFSRANT